MIWMWDAVYGGLEGRLTDKTARNFNQERILASKKKPRENLSLTQENIFQNLSYDEYSYDTPYLQYCTVKKMFLKIFFPREFSSAAPSIMVGGVDVGGNEKEDVKSSKTSLDESTRDEQNCKIRCV